MGDTPTIEDLSAHLKEIHPERHPMLPWVSMEEALEMIRHDETRPAYVEWVNTHKKRVALAEDDPLRYGFEPPCWADADRWLERDDVDIQANFGVNRGAKSFRAAKRLCEAAMAYDHGQMLVLGETEDSSIRTQQALVWYFLRHDVEHLNGKRHPIYKINHSEANGFTDGTVVLPNHTLITFDTYGADPGKYEGWEFGAKVKELKYRKDGSPILNVGVWPDESMTMAWLSMISRRAPFRGAKTLWTFTPVRGITPAVKEFLGTPQVIETRPADMLPQSAIPNCPKGHMPYIVKPAYKRSNAIYTHLDQIVFGGYEKVLREAYTGKPTEIIERICYGYARDSVARAFPMFGQDNIVPVPELPAHGTIYQIVDPHGSRNYACIWVLVTSGNPPTYWVIRDWPDEQTYGEWAMPTEREVNEDTRKGWDGDPGPAQNGQGWGYIRYKQLFLDLEKVAVPGAFKRMVAERSNNLPGSSELEAMIEKEIRHPWRRNLVLKGVYEGDDLDDIRERPYLRMMDSRFAHSSKTEAKGKTCLRDQYAEEQRDEKTGEIVGPRMDFTPTSGKSTEHGISLLSGLLEWDRSEDLVPGINAPHLYVSEECRQVIWALSNYTGRAGESGACKEWIDLLRYLAEEAPMHIEGGMLKTRGSRGGY